MLGQAADAKPDQVHWTTMRLIGWLCYMCVCVYLCADPTRLTMGKRCAES